MVSLKYEMVKFLKYIITCFDLWVNYDSHNAGLTLQVAEEAFNGECPKAKSSSSLISPEAPEQSGSSTHLDLSFSDLFNWIKSSFPAFGLASLSWEL